MQAGSEADTVVRKLKSLDDVGAFSDQLAMSNSLVKLTLASFIPWNPDRR